MKSNPIQFANSATSSATNQATDRAQPKNSVFHLVQPEQQQEPNFQLVATATTFKKLTNDFVRELHEAVATPSIAATSTAAAPQAQRLSTKEPPAEPP